MIDLIVNDVSGIESSALEIIDKAGRKDELLNKLTEFSLPLEALAVIKEYIEVDEVNSSARYIKDLSDKVLQNTNNITLSLQVQDITSQQLAAVNHLICSVKERLVPLINNLEETNANEFEGSGISAPVGAAFDPNASYSRTDGRQEAADAIINDQNQLTSQDEIDRLFS